jgi:Spy/CpxP family protein refolding chaperone
MLKKAPKYLFCLALAVSAWACAPLLAAAQEEEQPQARRGQALRNLAQQQQVHPLQRWLRQQMMLLQGLDLTQEQRQRLRAIPARYETDWQNLSRRSRQARNGFERVLAADEDIKPEIIEERSRAVGAAEAEFARLVGQIWNEVKQVLTPEQRQQLREIRANQLRQRQLPNRQAPVTDEPSTTAPAVNRQQNPRRLNNLLPKRNPNAAEPVAPARKP